MCNLIYALKKSAAFPVAIFMKFASAQRHFEQISYIEFKRNRETNAESKARISYSPLSKVLLSLSRFSRSSFHSIFLILYFRASYGGVRIHLQP